MCRECFVSLGLTRFPDEEDGDDEHEENRKHEPIVLADGKTPGPAVVNTDRAVFYVGRGSVHQKRLATGKEKDVNKRPGWDHDGNKNARAMKTEKAKRT
jgi:hypothetical protein